jgi:hypothetical protein
LLAYYELRPRCPTAVGARSPSPPTKQAATSHPHTRHELPPLLCGAPPSGPRPASQCVATPSLDHLGANRAACCSSSAGGSPEQELKRRPPSGAAVHPAGSLFSSNQAPKSSLGESLVVSPPFSPATRAASSPDFGRSLRPPWPRTQLRLPLSLQGVLREPGAWV